nr:hypothetical protein [uncultured Flavobacterium sp.]
MALSYDLSNVKLILAKDNEEIALQLGGKRKIITENTFERFAFALQLNEKQMNSVFNRISEWVPKTEKLIQESFLTKELQADYIKSIIRQLKKLL